MLPRLVGRVARPAASAAAQASAGRPLSSAPPPPAPEKIECFIDGKKVLVDPGTTVLQVNSSVFRINRDLTTLSRP